LNNHFGFYGMLVQPLELEYLQPESIQLEQPLVTITILNTDFENSFMRYWISTGATFGHNPKH